MNCIIHTMSCNCATHATYSLAFTLYKYSELQVSFVIKKLSCKANCKTPFFIMEETKRQIEGDTSFLVICFDLLWFHQSWLTSKKLYFLSSIQRFWKSFRHVFTLHSTFGKLSLDQYVGPSSMYHLVRIFGIYFWFLYVKKLSI
jgi:hypothetical protein